MTNTPSSLYEDDAVASDYLQLINMEYSALQISSEDTEAADDAWESFYRSLVSQIYSTLERGSQGELPPLHLHTAVSQLDLLGQLMFDTVLADREGVHVGLGFVKNLDMVILDLSDYLMENFLIQIAPPQSVSLPQSVSPLRESVLIRIDPPLGESLSLPKIVSVEDFPSEALSFYSANLIPEAESRDGYQKRLFQFLMETLQEADFAPAALGDGTPPLSRLMPKPLLDLVSFFDQFKVDRVLQRYLDPNLGPYMLRLHLQLLLDGLYFLLAHELAHHQLRHLQQRTSDVAQRRQFEADADMAALSLLRTVPGFQLRSLPIVFNFAGSREPDVPPDQIDHPFARNRLLILADAIMRAHGGAALRADLNTSMALISTPLEPYYLTFGWPNEAPEDVDVYMSHYSDMDFTAHLLLYIDRPPRHANREDGWKENAFLLAHLTFDINFALRDRIQPEQIYARGRVMYHPTIRPKDLFISYRTESESIYTRLHLPVTAPPEWWLGRPDAELAIESVNVNYGAPNVETEDKKRAPFYFYYTPVEFDFSTFFQSLPLLAPDPTVYSNLLFAARRYSVYQRFDVSIQLYQWLYGQNPDGLAYGDLTGLCGQLLSLERFTEAEEVARWALGPGRPIRPGFHGVLMECHASREEVQEAYEEGFLEMATVGKYGEFFEEARQVCAQLASYPNDSVMAAWRDFIRNRDTAQEALKQSNLSEAQAAFRAARQNLLAAQSCARGDFLFLRECLAEVEFELCRLDDVEVTDGRFKIATAAFNAILERMPNFVPARMHLAYIALLEGNPQRARAIWQEARAITPFHNFVFEFRQEVEARNPDFHLTYEQAEQEEG